MTEHDEPLIRAVLESRIAALHAKDAEELFAAYTRDVVWFDLTPPLRFDGPAALDRQAIETWFGTWQGPIKCELRDLTIAVGGDLAWCHGLQRLSGTKIGGETDDIWVRLTACLRREDDGWRIAHEHLSVPFHMDGSYRAAVDLEPA